MDLDLNLVFPDCEPVTSSIADCLRFWAERQPEKTAYAWFDGEESETVLTYAELDRRARAIGADLQARGLSGKRVLLLYPPGLDFICGFFGCLYGGCVAVPAYPPRRNRNMNRISAISDDAQAAAAFTVFDVLDRMDGTLDEAPTLRSLEWIATDTLDDKLASQWEVPQRTKDSVAVLQYTSGSTGQPKGVVLSHGNLTHNTSLIAHAFRCTPESRGLSWLPTYHDMGLVGGVLNAMFAGCPCILMSPMSFLQKPVRWLRGISRYGVTISGGPNFAYDLCVQKVTDDQIEGLDLSRWEVAFNGAEPVRTETLKRFTERFGPVGFRHQAHYPCYGMAETTLIVTGCVQTEEPVVAHFHGKALDDHRIVPVPEHHQDARALVGCGRILPEEEVVIVDTMRYVRLPEDRVGEIWISSDSVGQGYWKKLELTDQTFRAKLTNSPGGPYLRSGDLGFLHDGELFVTGRVKDLIIIRGVNRYPQDIELTVEKSSNQLQAGAVGAFAVDVDGRERLVIVAEVERKRRPDWSDVIAKIRKDVTAEHELPPDGIVLVRFGSIPKTSSGKIQRHACRSDFVAGNLSVVDEWYSWDKAALAAAKGDDVPTVAAAAATLSSPVRHSSDVPDVDPRVVEVVIERIRAVAADRSDAVDLDTNISIDLGLDSLERLRVANSLEITFGGRFPDRVLAEIDTVRDVAAAIERYIGTTPRPDIAAEQLAVGDKRSPEYAEIPAEFHQFAEMREFKNLDQAIQSLAVEGLENPYFTVNEAATGAKTIVKGREVVNFASSDYLGMSGDAKVVKAAEQALQQYGTSVSASRLVSGERTLHRELESSLAQTVGTEEALAFVSGHVSHLTTVGHLFEPGDLILVDSQASNSILQGAMLSSARRREFPHRDWEALDDLLQRTRNDYRRVLIGIEGVSGFEGDIPDLPKFIEVKNRHKALLLVDESHALGTLGKSGRGVAEHFDCDAGQVDIWSGTLDAALGSCGGFVAGSRELVQYLKYTAPGFVYSVGLAPPNAAAALESLKILQSEPQRVEQLQSRAKLFHDLALEHGLGIGTSLGTPIVPVLVGSSDIAIRLSTELLELGFNVQPIVAPVVDDADARLRFLITADHSEEQIRDAIRAVFELMKTVPSPNPLDDSPLHAS